MAMSRSVCSVLVGMPVLGPARCTSMMINGSSVITASPTVSCLSTMPGPDVVVMPKDPPKEAPSAAPTPAISSSAWNVRTPKRLCLDNSWRMSEAGVIGYEPRNSESPDRSEPAMSP